MKFKRAKFKVTGVTPLMHNNPQTVNPLNDYAKIVVDTIKYETGKKILKSLKFEGEEVNFVSSLTSLQDNYYVEVYGGKTGFTYEAGLNLCVLYEQKNRSYLLLLANADGEYREHNNLKDALKIFEFLSR